MRLTLFRALCALAAIASLVAFTGCGGSSNKTSDYKDQARTVAQDFKNSAEKTSQQVSTATTTDERVKGLEALKGSVDDAANGFEDLTPPDNVKSEHEQLIAGFRSLSSDISEVENGVKTNDKNALQATLPKLQADQTKVQQAVQALQAKIGD
jgi:uncharacterized phage infection (PIP) family protein YhgE